MRSSIGTLDRYKIPSNSAKAHRTSFPRQEQESLAISISTCSYLAVYLLSSSWRLRSSSRDCKVYRSRMPTGPWGRPTSGCSRLLLISSLKICGPLALCAATSVAIASAASSTKRTPRTGNAGQAAFWLRRLLGCCENCSGHNQLHLQWDGAGF